MTIPFQVSAIFEHPFFKQAVKSFASGNETDLRHVISEIHIHTYLTVAQNCGRAFRMNKWAHHPEIYSAIKDIAPPSNLDIKFPIPLIIDEPICKVIPLRAVKSHRYPKINHTPNQLELAFPIRNKASRLLQEA